MGHLPINPMHHAALAVILAVAAGVALAFILKNRKR